MQHEEILDLLKQLLEEKYGVAAATLGEDSRQAELGLDSMLLVDLMMDVEDAPPLKALGFTFTNMDLPRNPSLGDIVELISANLPVNSSEPE